MDLDPKTWLIAIVGVYIAYHLIDVIIELVTKKTVIDTVVDKERHDKYYIVYGKAQVYRNSDSWVYSKFNSSNIQAQLTKGGKYELTIVGFRFPIFSNYQNIVKIKKI